MSLATITTVLALSVMPAAATAPGPASGPDQRTFAFVSHARGEEKQRLREFGSCLDVVAPNWYTLDPTTGAIGEREPDADVVAGSRRAGYELWPVVNAQTGGDAAITSPAIQARIAAAAGALADRHDYDGVTLDIEGITRRQGGAFTRLVEAVRARLRREGRKLAVYAPRRTAEPPVDSAAGYLWGRLSRLADLLLVSGYNEHYAGGEPGPVATRSGFDAVVEHASSVSRRRVAPILGAFGYAWPESGERARLISMVDARELLAGLGGTVTRRGGQLGFSAGGERIWVESARGLRGKAAAAGGAGMRWIALFSLGREPRGFWRGRC